jgi:hypothetical protein
MTAQRIRVGRMASVLVLVAMAIVAGVSSSAPLQTIAAAETDVSAAAEGIFPSGAAFGGVSLQGSTFGIGVVIRSNGSAVGEFQTVLLGTSLLGSPQSISLEGAVSSGLLNADGSATFSGTATLDMGDGSLPTTVPFAATITTGGLQLTIGTTPLPAQGLGAGSISIQ